MKLPRLFIIGSGASVNEGLDKGLQNLLTNEVVFTLNEEFQFFNSTVEIFGDWTFYKGRYDLLKNHPLIIGRFDREIGKRKDCPYLPQLILLPSCSKYIGKIECWKNGFFTGVLTGMFALSIAIALGFKEIYLLGYDGKAINEKTHHYEGINNVGIFTNADNKQITGVGINKGRYATSLYNKDINRTNEDYWSQFICELPQVDICNVSFNSIINTFPKISYDSLFSMINKNPTTVNQESIRQYIKQFIKTNAKFDKPIYYNQS